MPRPKRPVKALKLDKGDEVEEVKSQQGMKRLKKTNDGCEKPSKVKMIADVLDYLYPEPPIPLNGETDYQLLVAIVLSAQTTDIAVNACTSELFKQAPDPKSMVSLGLAKITGLIQTLGLYKNKAKSVLGLSQILVDSYEGNVDNVKTKEELMSLPGVGPKTASVFFPKLVESLVLQSILTCTDLRIGGDYQKKRQTQTLCNPTLRQPFHAKSGVSCICNLSTSGVSIVLLKAIYLDAVQSARISISMERKVLM